MPKELRQIQKQDLLPQDSYAKNRKQLRKELIEFKICHFGTSCKIEIVHIEME